MTVLNSKEKFERGITSRNTDLKSLVVKRLEEIVDIKYKLLKVESIFFEKEGGEISYISISNGYNILIRNNGTRVFPRAANGKELVDIINCLNSNNFYGYITDVDKKKYKIRPKNKK